MSEATTYDLAVVEGDVVFPGREVRRCDIGVAGERIVAIAEQLPGAAAICAASVGPTAS